MPPGLHSTQIGLSVVLIEAPAADAKENGYHGRGWWFADELAWPCRHGWLSDRLDGRSGSLVHLCLSRADVSLSVLAVEAESRADLCKYILVPEGIRRITVRLG